MGLSIEQPTRSQRQEMVGKAMNIMTLLGAVNSQMSTSRREFLKPPIAEECKNMCDKQFDNASEFLFGDSLSNTIKEAKDSHSMSRALTGKSKRSYEGSKHRESHQQNKRSRRNHSLNYDGRKKRHRSRSPAARKKSSSSKPR